MQNIDPVIIKQFLSYWLIIHSLNLILPLTVLGFSIYGFKIAFKERDHQFGTLMFIAIFLSLVIAILFISDIIQIVYAPNIYIYKNKAAIQQITK